MTAEIVAYIDGGARGNPGPAGYGVRIERPDGTVVDELAESIGVATNNVAEYRALLAALEWSRAHGYRAVHVRSDSLLLVQQMLGNYRVKHPGLQALHARARLLAHDLGPADVALQMIKSPETLLLRAPALTEATHG